MIRNDRPDAMAVFSLPNQLDVRAAKPLKESLSRFLLEGRPLTIDATGVARMSTACAQVIVAFAIAARTASLPVDVQNISPEFDRAIALLGLSSFIKVFDR